MEKDRNFDVIVIGAGPGGSAAAALLAKAGKRVLLVDKNPSAGGRMRTIHDAEGFHYELFPINGCPANGSRMDEVLEKIGKADAVKRIDPRQLGLSDIIYLQDAKGELRSGDMMKMDLSMLRSMRISLLNVRGILHMRRFVNALERMTDEEIDALSMTPAAEFVDRYGPFPGMFRTEFLHLCEGAFETPCDKTPASELVKFFRQTMQGGAGRYYEYGIGRVFEVYAQAVEELGGRVLFSTRVKRILVEGGAAKGILLENGEEYRAEKILSSAGIRQTVLNLVGEGVFDPQYCARIRALMPNLACIGYRWFLDAPVVKHPMTVVFSEGGLETWEQFRARSRGEGGPMRSNYVYFGTTSLYPNTAPRGKQLVYAVTSCYPNPSIDAQPYLDYIERVVRRIAPELFSHIYRAETMTPAQAAAVGTDALSETLGGEAYGVANAIGQAGKQRPSPISPIQNLYYVGNDAGGFGLGTQQAVDSAVRVAELVLSGQDKTA